MLLTVRWYLQSLLRFPFSSSLSSALLVFVLFLWDALAQSPAPPTLIPQTHTHTSP